MASPAGRMSRSGSSAQASSTRWYHVFSFSRPNMTLSWTVAFWIQACCGTYATEPCEDTCQEGDCQYLLNENPQLWIELARGAWAQHLNRDAATSFFCFTKHGGQQRGLSTAHMSDHSDEGAPRHMDVDPVNRGELSCKTPFVFIADLVLCLS